MKVSGFSFVRNAISNGYPLRESICSLLPLVDEYVIAVGQSDDSTLDVIKSLDSPKIKVIETVWNECMTDRGFVYGQQKMIAQYNCTGDWLFYLEADEVLHEKDLPFIRSRLASYHDNPQVEALYFNFLHFYGSPSFLGVAGYRQAPRVIKSSVRSIAPDGLFFVVLDDNKKDDTHSLLQPGAKSIIMVIVEKSHLPIKSFPRLAVFGGTHIRLEAGMDIYPNMRSKGLGARTPR